MGLLPITGVPAQLSEQAWGRLAKGFSPSVLDEVSVKLGEFASSRKVDFGWLRIVLVSESVPVDGTWWPESWRGMTRVTSFFNRLGDPYWKAFGSTHWVEVSATLEEWNELSGISIAKAIRLFGKSVRFKKVYMWGRYLKDVVVLSSLKKQYRMDTATLIRNCVMKCKYAVHEATPGLIWKWNQWGVEKKEKPKSKGRLLEVG